MDDPTTTALTLEIFVDDRKLPFATNRVTAGEIKATAGVRADHSLYLRKEGGNEPFRDSERIWLEPGVRFFTRPPSIVS
jgi:multiubiquitin